MIYLSSLGLVCPVGYSPASAAAALRARVAAFSETHFRNNDNEPIIAAVVEALPPRLRGRKRIMALLRLVLEQFAPASSEFPTWKRVPLILCSRELETPGARIAGILAELRWPDGSAFAGARHVQVASGSVSAFEAIAIARACIAEGEASACLILAVDSLLDARVLEWLDRTERLKTSARTDGIIPGEAACLAVVSKQPLSDDHLAILGVGTALEQATVLDDAPFRAEGMTAALRAALHEAGLAMHDVDFRFSDVGGESYAFEELVLAQTRLMRKVRPSQPLWHPADCIGDTGAASGLIQLAWAAQAFARGYAPGPIAVAQAASAFGRRAAAIVAAPNWRRS